MFIICEWTNDVHSQHCDLFFLISHLYTLLFYNFSSIYIFTFIQFYLNVFIYLCMEARCEYALKILLRSLKRKQVTYIEVTEKWEERLLHLKILVDIDTQIIIFTLWPLTDKCPMLKFYNILSKESKNSTLKITLTATSEFRFYDTCNVIICSRLHLTVLLDHYY